MRLRQFSACSGQVLLDLLEGLALEHAEVPLAQAGMGDDRDARGLADGLRRSCARPRSRE
jgi:hypothetical protein